MTAKRRCVSVEVRKCDELLYEKRFLLILKGSVYMFTM